MSDLDTRERLIASGAILFAEKGFDGVSVREICAHAKTTMNMIHYFFSSKQGLLSAIMERFSVAIFEVPLRILAKPFRDRDEFEDRLLMFVEETLEALLANRFLLAISYSQGGNLAALAEHQRQFIVFLKQGKRKSFIRNVVDIEMISGLLLDRLVNQVYFSSKIKAFSGFDIVSDMAYRERWIRANLDVFFNGVLSGKKGEMGNDEEGLDS